MVASIVHLKTKYHNIFGELVIIPTDLHRARLICKIILRNPWETTLTPKNKVKKTIMFLTNVVNLNICEKYAIPSDEIDSPLKPTVTTVRPIPNGSFKMIHLDENPIRSYCVWVYFSALLKKEHIECLRANVDLFAISPNNMPNIYPSVPCHWLNIDPST